MIDIKKFVAKWSGKKIDFDKAFGNQCVDLCKQWEHENGWKITMGNADMQYKNAGTIYTWIPNKPWRVPKIGDMIVFELGKYGHIGLVVSANIFSVKVFEQNYPIGSSCHLRNYNYIKPHCTGWLHKK